MGRRPRTSISLHVPEHPVVNHLGDGEVVLLDHHHMPVAIDAFILQRHPFDFHPGLVEILYRAIVVELVVGGFRRDHDGWNALQIDELPCRCRLHPAQKHIRAVRFLVALDGDLARVLDRRIVGQGDVGRSPGTCLAGADDGVFEWRDRPNDRASVGRSCRRHSLAGQKNRPNLRGRRVFRST